MPLLPDLIDGAYIYAEDINERYRQVYNWSTEGVHWEITNPAISSDDFSFASSPKGLMVDTVIDASGSLGCAIVGQIDIESGAPTLGSAQGVRGDVRVAAACEVYGVFGYVDWQHASANGAGAIFATRGLVADNTINGSIDGLHVVGEGDFPAANGIKIHSSGSGNKFHSAIRIKSAVDHGIIVEDLGVSAIPFTAIHANVGGPDSYTALFLDRTYNDVGDTMDIVYGANGNALNTGNRAGRLSMQAITSGVMGFVLYAQNGGDGYSNEIAMFAGNGSVKFAGLPSSNPGAGTKQLWYDPADGNRVKFAA